MLTFTMSLRDFTQILPAYYRYTIFRDSKVCGQTDRYVSTTVVFSTWIKNIVCSQWQPEVWSPWTLPHTRVSSLAMPCQEFTAATFSCCLFVGLSPAVTEKLLYNTEISWLTWPLKNKPFLELQRVLSCYHSMFEVISHLHSEAPSCQFCSMWPIHLRIHPGTSLYYLYF